MSEYTPTVMERARALSSTWCRHSFHEQGRADGFVEGATFAATITPEQVEAAARALHDVAGPPGSGDGIWSWEWTVRHYPDSAEDLRNLARAAFIAAGFQIGADS